MNRGFVSSSAMLLAGSRSRPGSSMSGKKSRSASYIGSVKRRRETQEFRRFSSAAGTAAPMVAARITSVISAGAAGVLPCAASRLAIGPRARFSRRSAADVSGAPRDDVTAALAVIGADEPA